MNQLKQILVGWDFSPGAEAALAQATRLAAWNESHLTVLHVIDEELIDHLAATLYQSRETVAAEALQTAVAEIDNRLARAGIAATARVVVGSPLHELLTATMATQADLLVIGARSNAKSGASTGTLATKLIRKASTKVMLVQPDHAGPYRTIMACVDYSENSTEAVKQALRVAGRDGSSVHCLHVFEPPWNNLNYRLPKIAIQPDLQNHFEASMLARLRAFVGAAGGRSELAAVHGAEHHSRGITEFAQQIHANLIVLGTHGHSRLQYLLLGSTVEGLLRDLQCSVLTIRAKDAPNVFNLAKKL